MNLARTEPAALDGRFSSEAATASPSAEARELPAKAKIYGFSTVRPAGRPHVAMIAAAWLDETLCFVAGREERKAKNLAGDPRRVVTTGGNGYEDLDVVVDGEVASVNHAAPLERLVAAYAAKDGRLSPFVVRGGAFYREGVEGVGLVHEVAQTTVFGLGQGETLGQTRWRF